MTKVRFAPSPETHRHRVHDVLERARRAAPAVGEGVAGRWLSGMAVFADRDGRRTLALLRDDSRRVRGIALCAAPLACDDDQAAEALRIAWSVRGERRLLRRMARHARTAAIDAFLDGLAAAGQLRDLIDDLPFGSEACLRRHLAHALERPSQRFWDGLALGHPGVLAELLLARWRAVTGEADPPARSRPTPRRTRRGDRARAARSRRHARRARRDREAR